ncbi:MAG: T9SS type A sorting domain-containing protein [Rhodothermales bacterium]
MTKQTSSRDVFTITNDDLIVPVDPQFAKDLWWTWGEDITLKFQAGKKLIVNDTLVAKEMTLTSSGSNWGGVEFKDGSKGDFTNVDVLKVGSGVHTGTMTIRDGADVTLKGDNIIIGPNFIAEKGSTFLATHDLTGSAAPNGPSPDLEENESIADAAADDNLPGFSITTYPNPFNPSTTLSYQLEEGAFVTLKVYNLLGQEIKMLVYEFQDSGKWESIWDGRDLSGHSVPSGTYLYRLTAGDLSTTGQMVLVK